MVVGDAADVIGRAAAVYAGQHIPVCIVGVVRRARQLVGRIGIAAVIHHGCQVITAVGIHQCVHQHVRIGRTAQARDIAHPIVLQGFPELSVWHIARVQPVKVVIAVVIGLCRRVAMLPLLPADVAIVLVHHPGDIIRVLQVLGEVRRGRCRQPATGIVAIGHRLAERIAIRTVQPLRPELPHFVVYITQYQYTVPRPRTNQPGRQTPREDFY